MPTYSYACNDCGNAFDVRQSFTDEPLTTCPECDGRLRKLFNAVGVVFKGSGFYRTDSRSSGKKSSAVSSTSSSSTSTSADKKTSTSSSSSTSTPAPAAKAS